MKGAAATIKEHVKDLQTKLKATDTAKASPGTLFQLGRTVIMCTENERGNNSNKATSDTAVLHLNALSPTEQREASYTRRWCLIN